MHTVRVAVKRKCMYVCIFIVSVCVKLVFSKRVLSAYVYIFLWLYEWIFVQNHCCEDILAGPYDFKGLFKVGITFRLGLG